MYLKRSGTVLWNSKTVDEYVVVFLLVSLLLMLAVDATFIKHGQHCCTAPNNTHVSVRVSDLGAAHPWLQTDTARRLPNQIQGMVF